MSCRRLLARLCIVREEIAELAAELSPQGQAEAFKDVYESNIMLHTQQVPQGTIHFLKELMTVGDEAKRYIRPLFSTFL